MNTIQYVDAPAGSGKTYSLTHYAVEAAKANRKIIIAQPSKLLIKQTLQGIHKIDPKVKVTRLQSEGWNNQVRAKIIRHIEEAAPHNGEILLITHEALKGLPDLTQRKFWELIIDEIPTVFEVIPTQIAITHNLVTDHFKTVPLAAGISAIQPTVVQTVRDLRDNKAGDQSIATFKDLLSAVLNPHKLVCVTDASYADLLNNPETRGHVDFFSILKPEVFDGYDSVTVMGANAQQTDLYLLWSTIMDVTFVPHPVIASKLQYTTHTNGHRLTLNYLFDERWSKSRMGAVEEDETLLDRVAAWVKAYMGETRFLWTANAKVDNHLFDFVDRLPNVSHGLDNPRFRSAVNVVCLTALNYRPSAYSLLDKLGIAAADAQACINYQADYQAMMRCSLRDPLAISPVRVILASKGSAEWIANLFPGCKVEKLESGLDKPIKKSGRPKGQTPPKTSTERARESRARKAADKAAGGLL